MRYCGNTLDIHGGGEDLIFPHHENEIAQSEAASGRPFVRYWLHNGFVNIDQEKMSKSLGNFFTIKEVLQNFNPESVRLFLLSTHYRSPIDFSDQNLKDAERARRRIYHLLQKVERALAAAEDPLEAESLPEEVEKQVGDMIPRFEEAMNDDFNSARALGGLFEIVRTLNGFLKDNKGAPGPKARRLLRQFQENLASMGTVLALFLEPPDRVLKGPVPGETLSPEVIEEKISRRIEARQSKDWAAADKIRDELAGQGVILKDHPDGTTDWERNR
jgi:cysteinyl-tRNA synthetase